MKRSEIAELLGRAGRYDRWVDAASSSAVEGWHDLIGGEDWLTYDLAADAVDAHYREESRTVMPADVLRRARDIRQRRLAAIPMPDPPAELLDDPAGWRAALTAAETAMLAGHDPAAAMAQVAASRRRELNGGRP